MKMKKTIERIEMELQEVTIEKNRNELQGREESNDLYYNDKGSDLLVDNQTETLAKAHSGFQLIVLRNNEDHQSRRTIDLLSKSEVQNNQRKIIGNAYKDLSDDLIIMTNAYSGIEQVCSELEIKEEETSIIQERE
jgi:hypothetical protein